MEKFKDLQYKRPDLNKAEEDLLAQLNTFQNASNYSEAKAAFLARQKILADFNTMNTIARVRSDNDTNNAFYRGEVEWFHEAGAKLDVVSKKFNEAFAASLFRPDFEKEYGRQLFKVLDADIKVTSETIIPEKVEEGKLMADYSKTSAGCHTLFHGKDCNFYGLLKYMLNTERNVRKEAMHVWSSLYESVSGQLEEEYAELCGVRRKEAEKLGFASYIDQAYLTRHRFDYTRKDIERFRSYVVKYIVPAAMRIHEEQRKRLGVEKLHYYDETMWFPDGNSTPGKDTQGMVDAAQQMYRELSPETGEFFDFMVEHELFDLETRTGKRMGGYTTFLPSYGAPYILSNFNKSSADTEVLTHEAGHAFESFTTFKTQELQEYRHSTSEVNEIHSMSMEFFTEPWYKLFYPEGQAERYVYEHLADSLANITYLVSVDEFQHCVFEGEQPDAAGLRKIWKDIEAKYMPWRDYDGDSFLESGGFWMQKQHIFLYPFYYVDYALAMLCALQFYLHMRKDFKGAWGQYMKLIRLGGSLGYFDLLKAAGLKNPFAEETIKSTAEETDAVLVEMEKKLS